MMRQLARHSREILGVRSHDDLLLGFSSLIAVVCIDGEAQIFDQKKRTRLGER